MTKSFDSVTVWGVTKIWEPPSLEDRVWHGWGAEGPIVPGKSGFPGVLMDQSVGILKMRASDAEDEKWTAMFSNRESPGALPSSFHVHHPPPKPGLKPIHLLVDSSSIKATLRWRVPPFNKPVGFWHAQVTMTEEGQQTGEFQEYPSSISRAEFPVKAGKWYRATVTAVHGKDDLLAWGYVRFKAIFNQEELRQTMDRAMKFLGTEMQEFYLFYRNKPQLYWDHIAHNRCGIMEVYIKDNNGHAANPLNGVIEGLFFNGKHRNGIIPGRSPFGEIRMELEAHRLLTPAHRLYFADFYCNSAMHYVTVLLTREGSLADRYARRFLIPLNSRSNPFLRLHVSEYGRSFLMNASPAAWVEVYFTENVPLVVASGWEGNCGMGRSTPGGLRNNEECTVCNIRPRLRSKTAPVTDESLSFDLLDTTEDTSSASLKRKAEVDDKRAPSWRDEVLETKRRKTEASPVKAESPSLVAENDSDNISSTQSRHVIHRLTYANHAHFYFSQFNF